MGRANWTARDWRQFVALTLLAAGDMPLTALLGWALWILWHQPRNGGTVMIAMGIVSLIAINRIGVSAVLGRRTFKFKVGDTVIDATGGAAERLIDRTEGQA